MQVGDDVARAAFDVTPLSHFSDEKDALPAGCVFNGGADSLVLVLPRPVSIDRLPYDVIRVTLASSLSTISWKDLDAVLLSDAASLFSLPWLSKNVSRLTTVACSSGLLRLAAALLQDVYAGQHVQFDVAGVVQSMFVTTDFLEEIARMLSPVYRLSPMSLLGGSTLTAFCSVADPGNVGWLLSRGDVSASVVVSRKHSIAQRLALGAVDEVPNSQSAVSRCYVSLSGVNEQTVIDAAAAALSALSAGGCVLGIASCPFAITRFILLLKETKVPMFWVGQKSEDVYDCLHTLAEYCNEDMLQRAYAGDAPFVLGNAFGEISTLTPHEVSCSTECIVVACCPSVDFVSSWAFSKPTPNVVLRFQ
jgi:hypothetical protein